MKETELQTKLSLKLQAYQYLKTKILNCEYRPNEFLNEQKLCAEMGNISRTPMRDALGRLEQEGLITILPKKGLMVSGITEEDVHSMFEMRLLVEPYALRTYGSSIPREQLEAFAELMHHPDRSPLFDLKGAEANQLHLLAGLQSSLDRGDERGQSGVTVLFGKAAGLSHGGDQFSLIHCIFSSHSFIFRWYSAIIPNLRQNSNISDLIGWLKSNLPNAKIYAK